MCNLQLLFISEFRVVGHVIKAPNFVQLAEFVSSHESAKRQILMSQLYQSLRYIQSSNSFKKACTAPVTRTSTLLKSATGK